MHDKLILPDNLLLQKITKQHLYHDKKSKDIFTNKIKPKYKLAGNCLLDYYFFHVLTTGEDACKRAYTLPLYLSDWECVVPVFKLKQVCYCDLTKYESINKTVLIEKMKDRDNGFAWVGRLCDYKYKKLLILIKKLRKSNYVSMETKGIVEAGILSSIDTIQTKLNLN